MHRHSGTAKPTAAAVLSRALEMNDGEVASEGARFILNLGLRDEDKARMLELLTRCQAGEMTAEEADELGSYVEADNVLSVLRAKALVARSKIVPGP